MQKNVALCGGVKVSPPPSPPLFHFIKAASWDAVSLNERECHSYLSRKHRGGGTKKICSLRLRSIFLISYKILLYSSHNRESPGLSKAGYKDQAHAMFVQAVFRKKCPGNIG